MPFQSVEQGIKAIQAGNHAEGARLLRIALRDTTEITGKMRAVALVWLAETMTTPDQKIQCYKDALVADPGNAEIQQRMAALMMSNLPPAQDTPIIPMPPVQTPAPVSAQTVAPMATPAAQTPAARGGTGPLPGFYRTVGVYGGRNGPGTGFFVALQGLLVTTRYVVGGLEHLTVMLDGGQTLPGRVVRSYPDMDMALVQVNLALNKLLPITPTPMLPDGMPLMAISHSGRAMNGAYAATKRDMPVHWFATTIKQVADAGGDPIFDDRNYLVGMLTRNISHTSGYIFGLHIASIQRSVDNYIQELRLDPNRVYCPSCGYLSRASNVGAFYCEVCGGTLPFAQEVTRFPIPQAEVFYGENMHTPCRHCGSRLGYYNGRCLRCGNELNAPVRK